MKAQILFILCFIFNVTIAKEHYQFRHLTTSDGLSDNEVIAKTFYPDIIIFIN